MRSKRILLVAAAAILALSALAPTVSAESPHSGNLHVTKECSAYNGRASEFCTITSSNLWAIPVGSRVIYEHALVYPVLDADITLALTPAG
jgi:hypothetical protein